MSRGAEEALGDGNPSPLKRPAAEEAARLMVAMGRTKIEGKVTQEPGRNRFQGSEMRADLFKSYATCVRKVFSNKRGSWETAHVEFWQEACRADAVLYVPYQTPDRGPRPLLFVPDRDCRGQFDILQVTDKDPQLPWTEYSPSANVHPRLLDTLSQAHTWAFGAIAELFHNAENNNARHIGVSLCDDPFAKGELGAKALFVVDDGDGLDKDGLERMLRFGGNGDGTSRYGIGFKSGSMRLGKVAFVFSRKKGSARDSIVIGALMRDDSQNLETPVFQFPMELDAAAKKLDAESFRLATISDRLLGDDEAGSGLVVIVRCLRKIDGALELEWIDDNSGRLDIHLRKRPSDGEMLAYIPSRQDQKLDDGVLLDFDWRLRSYCEIIFNRTVTAKFRTRQVQCKIVFGRNWRDLEKMQGTSKAISPVRVTRLALKKVRVLQVKIRADPNEDRLITIPIVVGRDSSLPEGACGVHVYWKGILIQPLLMPLHHNVHRESISRVVALVEVDGTALEPLNNKQGFDKFSLGYNDFVLELRRAMLQYVGFGEGSGNDYAAMCDSCSQWRTITPELLPKAWDNKKSTFYCKYSRGDDGQAKTCDSPPDNFPLVSEADVEVVDGVVMGPDFPIERRRSFGNPGRDALELRNVGDLEISDDVLYPDTEPDTSIDTGDRAARKLQILMAPVVVCRATWHGANVAVKLIDKKRADIRPSAEFEQMARLRFPHIVQLFFHHRSFEWNQHPRYVIGMELLDGFVTLKSLLESNFAKGRSPAELWQFGSNALAIAKQQAAALAYMHAFNLCHNDIHPSNVMVQLDPRPESNVPVQTKLIDFGLSRCVMSAASSATLTPLHAGSSQFRSPEKVTAGSKWKPTQEADVYSFGLLLRCLAGATATPFGPMDESQVYKLLGERKVASDVLEDESVVLDFEILKHVDDIGAQCRAGKPGKRVPMSVVVKRLEEIKLSALDRFRLHHNGLAYCWHVISEAKGAIHADFLISANHDIHGKGSLFPTVGLDQTISVAEHVRSNPGRTPWVSLSANPLWALFYAIYPSGIETHWKQKRIIVKVDLTILDERGVHWRDLTDPAVRETEKLQGMTGNFAVAAEEVVVFRSVPKEAIVARFVLDPNSERSWMTRLMHSCLVTQRKPSFRKWAEDARLVFPGNELSGFYENILVPIERSLQPANATAAHGSKQEDIQLNRSSGGLSESLPHGSKQEAIELNRSSGGLSESLPNARTQIYTSETITLPQLGLQNPVQTVLASIPSPQRGLQNPFQKVSPKVVPERKCSACGESGHIRTNQNCPKYRKPEQRPVFHQ